MISRSDVGDIAVAGCVGGVGMIVVPATTTWCLTNVRSIAYNIAMNVLAIPCGFVVYLPNAYPAIPLPMMWKFSYYAGLAGGALLVASLVVIGVERVLQSRAVN